MLCLALPLPLRRQLGALLLCALSYPSLADEPGSVKLPAGKNYRSLVSDSWYPQRARRLSQQGRVLVEFGISSKGRAVDITVPSSEPAGVFDKTATTFVRAVEFDVPRDWEVSDASHHRFRLSFVFLLRPCLDTGSCEEVAQFPSDGNFTVTEVPLTPPPRR